MPQLSAQKNFIFISLLLIVFILSLWLLTRVWLLVFAAILVAVCILSLISALRQLPFVGPWLQKAPHGVMVALVLLLIATVFAIFGALFGQELFEQLDEMKTALPAAMEKLQQYLDHSPLLVHINEWLTQNDTYNPIQSMINKGLGFMPGVITGLMNGMTNFMIIILLGLFLAISPSIYVNSFISLIPIEKRDKGRYLFQQSYQALKQWLLGQFVVMSFVGVCTTVALWFMDIPFALAMGFISFLLDFIPVIGPWLAAIPIVLITLLVAPDMVIWVILVMFVVQQLESYVVAPLVQQKLVNLPPVALLVSQVIMGSLMGFFGVALATPFAVTLIVWIQIVYIKFTLGDYKVRVLGQDMQDMIDDKYAKARNLDSESVFEVPYPQDKS